MSSTSGPVHVVVDGSNIATEGRSMPSLTQLNEAVMAFMEEHPDALVTVVVDATFGHRIPKSEADEFEAGISNNELVAPPAGAVGRGDAFVLGIADKAGAAVLSNDSFQEFHGEYEWLFDEGRLIGGKPVPHVGWVFVDRVPVRGPVSRKATRSTKGTGDSSNSSSKRSRSGGARRSGKASKAASEPMPVPTSPPPGRGAPTPEPAAQPDTSDSSGSDGRRRAPRANEPVNDLLPFLEFVEHHPVGTSVNGTVDAYSSHGAYVTIGDQGVRAYVPLRLMADPPPRSARKVMKVGESVTLVVVSFAPERRSIDCAVPDMADREIADVAAASSDPELVARATSEAADGGAGGDSAAEAEAGGTPPKRTRKKTATRKTAAREAATKKSAAKKAATKKAAAKKSTAKKSATKKAATKETAARKKAASRKSAAEATSTEKAATKKAATEQTAAKKAAAKKTTGRKTAAKRTGAKKSTARKTAARRSAKTSAAAESASPSPAAEAPADPSTTAPPPADAEG
jgi:hypothetical protein